MITLKGLGSCQRAGVTPELLKNPASGRIFSILLPEFRQEVTTLTPVLYPERCNPDHQEFFFPLLLLPCLSLEFKIPSLEIP